MKICFLEGDLSRTGGTERMTAWLANSLCDAHQVHILSLQLRDGGVFFPLKDAVTHQVLPKASGTTAILKQIRWIARYLREHQIDRVINVDMGMGFYGILAAKGTKAKVITWEHGNFCNNWGSRLFPYLRRYAAKKSDAVILLTQKDRENYDKHIKGHAPIIVIGNPAVRHDYTYDPNSRMILSVGHLLPNKGYHRVVEIAAKILPHRPEWRWVICGEGPERQALEDQIRASGLEGRVLLPGLMKDMDAQYQKAAILVLTSDMEGLPMTLLEGKSWGLPLVAFDIMTGPSDIIEDGTNGYLVSAFNLDAIAQKLAALMDDDSLRTKMSAASIIGIDRFAPKNIIDMWEHLLKEI